MRTRRIALTVTFLATLAIALNFIGFGNGRCDLPVDDDASRRLVATQALHEIFARHNLAAAPEDYLRDNPFCCRVFARDFSLVDYVFWDNYSRPIFNATIRATSVVDGKLLINESFGLGDRCGRMPDAFGEESEVTPPSNLDLTINRAIPLSLAIDPVARGFSVLDDPRSGVTDNKPWPSGGELVQSPRQN